MYLVRILLNAVIMGGEIGGIVAVSALGYAHPYVFAGLTAALSLALGLRLERMRLINELAFYFGPGVPGRPIFIGLVAMGDALVKGIVAGIAALLTFSGTDANRLFWVAVVFGCCLYAGSSLLRWLSIRFSARPTRWGYFRLAAPLGLLFSVGIALLVAFGVLAAPSLPDIGRHVVWEMPERPTIEQVSELLFLVKQYIDGVIVAVLGTALGPDAARAAGVVLSVNVLSGFVVAIYAVLIAEFVRRLEDAWL